MAWRNSSSRGEPPSWRLIEHHSIIYATYKMFGATVPPSLVKMSPELLEEKAGEAAIQKLTDQVVAKAEEVMATKEKELLSF